MRFSRQAMALLDIPHLSTEAFKHCGDRKIKLYVGDPPSPPPAPAPATTSQTQTAELPEWARPYAKETLAKGAALTDINKNPYQTYGADRIAGFNPMQQQAQQQAQRMQPSSQLGMGTELAAQAGLGALTAQYQPGQFTNQFQAPQTYQPSQFGMLSAQAPNLQNYQMGDAERVQAQQQGAPTMSAAQTNYNPNIQAFQMGPADRVSAQQVGTPLMDAAQTGYRPDLQTFQMGPAEQVRTQSFANPYSASAYMSPYMQNVVEAQQREAQRSADIAGTQRAARATQAGAFGGSRQAIENAEAARNLATQKGDIQAAGLQSAYQQAQGQFNAEQQARLQAQQANQQAGLQVGGQNLQAALGVQQLGAQTGLQTSLANLSSAQQANVQNQAAQLQAQGLNAQQAMQAALANQQAGLQVGQQNLAAQQAAQQLGTQTGLQTSLANLSSAQQANVQNQAAQLQTQGLNAQQAMQAALANQQAGLQVGGQNLQAALGIQQLGAGQNLQAQLANQQAFQQAQTAGEQSRQFGAGQGLQAASLGAQYGQSAQQLGEQSRQFGAGLGMQGLQTGLQAAGQLGQLGQMQYGQQMGINQLQAQYGAQQQAQQQQANDIAYQNFLNQQNYPYKQLGYMSDMIRGMPLGQQSTASMYQAPPSAIQSAGSLGLGAYGLSQLFKAEGGQVHSYAGGGVTSDDNVQAIIDRLSPEQLKQAKQAALSRRDMQTVEAIDARLAELASEKSITQGIAGVMPEQMADDVMQAAGGGILAFARGSGPDAVEETETPDEMPIFGTAPPDLLARASRSSDELRNFQAAQLTPEQRDQAIRRRYELSKSLAGEDVAGKERLEMINRGDTDREEMRNQGKGLAALAAMQGLSQGNNLIRGLGQAGGAFAQTYAPVLQADRRERLALADMKFNLMDAQRKERMGMKKDAIAAAAEAEKNQRDADKFAFDKLKAKADIDTKIAMAGRPIRTGGGAGANKPNSTIWQVEQLAAQIRNEHKDWTPEQVNAEAVTQFNQQTKGQPSVAKTYADAAKDFRSYTTLNRTKVKKIVEDRFGGDEEAYKEDYIGRYMQGLPTDIYTPKGKPSGAPVASVGGSKTPPPPSGFVTQ